MDSIRGHEIRHILDSLYNVEQKIRYIPESRKKNSYYRRYKEWLINEKYLEWFVFNTIFPFPGKRIPFFCLEPTIKGILKCFVIALKSERYRSKASAGAIRVKNNVRAFYTGNRKPFCVKILISNIRTLQNMKTEIETRKKIVEYNTINIPELLDVELDFSPPFFTEELIWGDRPTKAKDNNLMMMKLFPNIWETYEKYGIKAEKLRGLIDLSATMNTLKKAVHLSPVHDNADGEKLITKASQLFLNEGHTQHSIGHGDLSTGNIIISKENNVYLADWEQAREMPIIFDLFGLIYPSREARDYFRVKIESVSDRIADMTFISFDEQMLVATLLKVCKWANNYATTPREKLPGLVKRISDGIDFVLNTKLP